MLQVAAGLSKETLTHLVTAVTGNFVGGGRRSAKSRADPL